MTSSRISTLALLAATVAACGNYSNEDLEFLNAVPAAEDITANIPAAIMPANEAELSRMTHEVIAVFNGSLQFLETADVIRTYPATSRIPNGRIWGPVAMDKNPGWQWRFFVTRRPATPEWFDYAFEVQRIGSDPNDWIPFISGDFVAMNGVRKGRGHFKMVTDPLRLAGFEVGYNAKGEMLKELTVDYSTETFPINVQMTVALYTQARVSFDTWVTIEITYEAQQNGQGAIEFIGTGSDGNSIAVTSRWLASGRGRADATVTGGPVDGQTRTQCWNDSFEQTYNNVSWDPAMNAGDIGLCPDISTL